YTKETMCYYFYFPPENKVIVARYGNFLKRDLISQKFSGRDNDLEDDHMDTLPSENTSEIPVESESLDFPPKLIPVRRIDYRKTFSPVADIRAIRILIAIAAYYDYEILQMDVKTAFLNGCLDEDIYMEQPEGYVDRKYSNRVCKLQRSIYGLKQASRQYNKRFDE
nr:retrotransposon protein, putative, Ty1-copia subclass [Tanacetum cinerariifolium]